MMLPMLMEMLILMETLKVVKRVYCLRQRVILMARMLTKRVKESASSTNNLP